jgi:hypothetical protein
MKSPYVIDFTPLKIMAVGGVLLCLFAILPGLLIRHETFTWGDLFSALGLYLCFIGIGLIATSSYSRAILRVKVKNPVNANDMVTDNTYWLNGETWARYLGIDPYTRKYRFNVFGVEYTARTGEYTTLLAGEVETYISTVCEDPTQKEPQE